MSEARAKKDIVDDDVAIGKKLSRLNGEVNELTKDKLVEKLKVLHLNTKGVKSVLKRRLKSYHKRKLLASLNGNIKMKFSPGEALYNYFLVIDFEATCDNNITCYKHEIIEFPAVLVNISEQRIVDEFHSYVKPVINKKLTPFCTELTGITQDTVDKAPIFVEVLNSFEEWLRQRNLGSKDNKFAVVTDGPWDMSRFMYQQCRQSRIQLPRWSRKWVNIRKSFCNAYEQPKASINLMLESFSIPFEGRQHSGICDSRNIANILIQMINDGCYLYENEKMFSQKINSTNNLTFKRKGFDQRYTAISRKELLKHEDERSDEEEDDYDNFDDDEGEVGEEKVSEYDDVIHQNGVRHNQPDNANKENFCKNTRRETNTTDHKSINESNSDDDCSDLLRYLSLRK